ncbi:hypothetical protein E2542_SST00604 [Spatholobus suberectus]|nr:hypothetical protein E2542_SST00604 [Spatholobus suberectus]
MQSILHPCDRCFAAQQAEGLPGMLQFLRYQFCANMNHPPHILGQRIQRNKGSLSKRPRVVKIRLWNLNSSPWMQLF